MLEAEAYAYRLEQLWNVVEILRGRPDVLARNRGVRRLVVHPVLRHPIRRRETGNARLGTNSLVPEAGIARDLVQCFLAVLSFGAAVDHHPVAAPASQE